jgi:hypothetical protein
MPAWTGKPETWLFNRDKIPAEVRGILHFHPAHAVGIYTLCGNAIIRQKVVVYDGKSRVSPANEVGGS